MSGDSGLKCNNRLCRATLGDCKVYVTFCRHIFCQRCGEMTEELLCCGFCRTDLAGDWKVVQVDQQPKKEFKSMVLTGLRPSIILDVAARALAFHYGQVQMEEEFIQDEIDRKKKQLNAIMSSYEEVVGELKMGMKELEQEVEILEERIKEKERMKDKSAQELQRKDFGRGSGQGEGGYLGTGSNVGLSDSIESGSSQGISSGNGSNFDLSAGTIGSGSSQGNSAGARRGYNFGLSLGGVSGSRSSYIANPQGGGETANDGRMFRGGIDDSGFGGGGSDVSMGSSNGSMRRLTDRESLASVMRSGPIGRIF